VPDRRDPAVHPWLWKAFADLELSEPPYPFGRMIPVSRRPRIVHAAKLLAQACPVQTRREDYPICEQGSQDRARFAHLTRQKPPPICQARQEAPPKPRVVEAER